MQDIIYAFRVLRRSPGVVLTVVVTIGLALGLNTTMFTIFNAYVLRPFDIRDPYSIYTLSWATKNGKRNPSFAEFEQVRAKSNVIETAFLTEIIPVTIEGQTFMGQRASSNYFQTLGVSAAMGRVTVEHDLPEMVLSYGAWKAKFSSDPQILGRSLAVAGAMYTVVGVARAGFEGIAPAPIDFWIPLSSDHPATLNGALLRLKRGATLREARAELAVLGASLSADKPSDQRVIGAELTSNAAPFSILRGANYVLFAPVFVAFGLILLIACANIANILLARAAARQKEMAIRLALGAGRARIIRQLLVESLLLAIPAAVAAFVIAEVTTRSALQLYFATVPNLISGLVRILPLEPDLRVFGFLLIAAFGSTLAFGLAPAIHAASAKVNFQRSRLRNALVVSQISVCVLLLTVSGMLLRGNSTWERYDPGFGTHNVFDLELQNAASVSAMDKLRFEPWVESVSAVSRAPLTGVRTIPIATLDGALVRTGYDFVAPEMFDLLRVPVLHGRSFTREEGRAEAPVAIITESTARNFWPGRDPLGQVIRIEPQAEVDRNQIPAFRRAQVIGVVRDIATVDVFTSTATPVFFFPTHPRSANAQALLLRVKQDSPETRRSLFETLERLAPGTTRLTFSFDEMLGVEMFPFKMSLAIAAFLGGLALVLAVSGVYGVLSYLVAQRMREIGIRVALGASTAAVVRLVLAQSARFALWGIGVGGLMALGVSRLFASVLEQINTYEPLAYGIAISAVFAASMLAAYIPSRRASRVDPASTLRHD
jgi:putative ABC transport system permease protein